MMNQAQIAGFDHCWTRIFIWLDGKNRSEKPGVMMTGPMKNDNITQQIIAILGRNINWLSKSDLPASWIPRSDFIQHHPT